MKETVPVAEATRDEAVLPERVQAALGQLVGAAKEGLLALSVEVGLGVLRELPEEEIEEALAAPRRASLDRHREQRTERQQRTRRGQGSLQCHWRDQRYGHGRRLPDGQGRADHSSVRNDGHEGNNHLPRQDRSLRRHGKLSVDDHLSDPAIQGHRPQRDRVRERPVHHQHPDQHYLAPRNPRGLRVTHHCCSGDLG